jgi:hypothetical protein
LFYPAGRRWGSQGTGKGESDRLSPFSDFQRTSGRPVGAGEQVMQVAVLLLVEYIKGTQKVNKLQQKD